MMKKLFLFFFLVFAVADASAIGLTEHNSFNNAGLQRKSAGTSVAANAPKVVSKSEVVENEREEVRTSKTISNSLVGLISGFFAKVFSIFFSDYMDLSLDGRQCLTEQKC